MRVITKLFCPSNHRIGTVGADAEGLVVEYSAEVWHTDGVFGNPTTYRLDDGDPTVLGAYCSTCRNLVQLSVPDLRAAAHNAKRGIHPPSLDAADKAWTDAGYPAIVPPGTPRHKKDPR